MPDNTINWGQGAVENTNDWGKGKTNSANNWGKVYETSPSGDTNIEGGLALSITYSASAYCDGIGDTPQPTVANNTGSGTFSSTSGIIFADSGSNTGSSTGVIDIDASTDGATYVITYTDTDSDTATANVTINALDNAAFAYSASSYEPTDADPTPTITGLTGGTFSSTSGLVFVDSGTNTGSSTGQIDLSATTEATYTITYDTTSSGSSVCPNTSTQSVEISVAAIANNHSFSFDGSNDYIDFGAGIDISGDATFSFWLYRESTAPSNEGGIITIAPSGATTDYISIALWADKIQAVVSNGSSSNRTSTQTISKGSWHHIVVVKSSTAITSMYINGSSETLATGGVWSGTINPTPQSSLMRAQFTSSFYTSGKLDEVGIWNTALTSTQIQSIYNATGTNLTKDLSTIESSSLKYWNRMGD